MEELIDFGEDGGPLVGELFRIAAYGDRGNPSGLRASIVAALAVEQITPENRHGEAWPDAAPFTTTNESIARAADSNGEVSKVALDIATWFVNGDRPDEWKLKEWAERLDRYAIGKVYESRSSGVPTSAGNEDHSPGVAPSQAPSSDYEEPRAWELFWADAGDDCSRSKVVVKLPVDLSAYEKVVGLYPRPRGVMGTAQALPNREVLDELGQQCWTDSRYSGRDGQDFDHVKFATMLLEHVSGVMGTDGGQKK